MNDWNLLFDVSSGNKYNTLSKSDAKHTLICLLTILVDLELNALTELSKNGQIQNDGRRQKRVFACVVDNDCVSSSEHQFADVLIHGPLRIAHIWHVFDNNCVIGLLKTTAIENLIRGYHIVNDIGLRDFFASELLGRRQIVAVIVTEMIVADDRAWLDASTDQEVYQHRLELSLTRLEVISSDEHSFVLCQFDKSGNKSVLRRTVYVSALKAKHKGMSIKKFNGQ